MKNLKTALKALFIMMGMVVFSNDSEAQVANPTNAYGDGVNVPMQQVESMPTAVYAIYSGDVNQDGTVDATDMIDVENDANIFAFGYNTTDVTGDGATDASDMIIIENNANLFLFKATPIP